MQLWNAYIIRMVSDVIYPFVLSDEKTVDQQAADFLIEKKRYVRYTSTFNYTDYARAKIFLESSSFDEVANLAGYDSLFVSKTFAFCQDVISRKKFIEDVLKKREEKRREEIRRYETEKHEIKRARHLNEILTEIGYK